MKLILGGGLTALLARDILGPDWMIIPIGKSRHYSFMPPLADNYINKDDVIDEYMQNFMMPVPILHKLGYSIAGQILYNATIPLPMWLEKVYGHQIPGHASAYWSRRSDFFVYGNCYDIYSELSQKYDDEIMGNNGKFGKPVEIKDHTITTEKMKFEYERVISTVPLPALLSWMGIDWIDLPSKDVYCFHIQTDELDFEGATSLFVADHEIDFYKVMVLNKTNYIFYTNKPLEYPAACFMQFMKEYELVAQTMIEGELCCGSIPRIDELNDADVLCIGKSAVWDDCLDIGSSIKRLVKL